MNYLAHAFLSSQNEGLMVGNFIGDHVKGNDYAKLPERIGKGVLMHRLIDEFTDNHLLFKESKRLFYDGFEKYSGILIDFYFDHLLAGQFEEFSKIQLQEFANRSYQVYHEHSVYLPQKSKNFLSYMVANNVYFRYSKLEGIETILKHFSHRINHRIALERSLNVFKENQESLESNFNAFMLEAIEKFKNYK